MSYSLILQQYDINICVQEHFSVTSKSLKKTKYRNKIYKIYITGYIRFRFVKKKNDEMKQVELFLNSIPLYYSF